MLFFSFLWPHCGIWKFPSQELNLSHNWHLCCSCSNAASSNSLHQAPGSNPCLYSDPSHCSQILNTLCQSRNSHMLFFILIISIQEIFIKLLLSTWHHAIYLFIYLLFGLFRAALPAHGSCQARGQVGAAAASLYHSQSNNRLESSLRPTPQLMATPDP